MFQLTDRAGGQATPADLPRLGLVLNTSATAPARPEGRAFVHYEPLPVPGPGGREVMLRRPRYRIELGSGQLLSASVTVSPRVAPALVGGGLLDAVPEAIILERADPDDLDGDRISGRPSWIVDTAGVRRIGRFGWKANQATLEQQVASALANEMGVTSPARPIDEFARTRGMPFDAAPEMDRGTLAAIVSFQRFAGVPRRAGLQVRRARAGAALFRSLGCEHCHRATLRTGVVSGAPALSGQPVHAFTDLLLHDMGDGLADGRPDGVADGKEWRTAPLWGLSLTGVVSRRVSFLHDGRARNLTEAILWHGGEARAASIGFAALSRADADLLLAYLGTL